MNRFTRKLTSLLGIVAVICAQLTLSAHACPMQFMGLGDASDITGAHESMTSLPDTAPPVLCQKHCEHAQQNVNDAPPSLAFVSFAPAFMILLPMDPPAPLAATAPARALLHATSPPHSIRNCCFRI